MSEEDLALMLGPWRSADGTLGVSLAAALAHLIESERLVSGIQLPPQRGLAGALGVARGTVGTAYEVLAGSGYITAEVGRGSRVNTHSKRRLRPSERASDRRTFYGPLSAAIDLSTQSLPAGPELAEALGNLTRSSLRPYLESDGHYPYGLPILRNAVARHLSETGIPTSSDQILITNGAQHALWLTVYALVGGEDTVLVDDPTYRGILAVLETVGARARSYAYAPDSIDLGIDSFGSQQASVLYCQPDVHSPTGQVMEPAALLALAEATERHGLLVIEDRSTSALRFDETSGPGLHSMVDPHRHVAIGTVSKLFWGGLRVGWIRGHPELIARAADVKQAMDITSPVVDQFLAVEVLDLAHTAIPARRQLLQRQLTATAELLHEYRPTWRWTEPRGGSALWVDTGADVLELAMRAQHRGIRIADGPSFSLHDNFARHLRIPLSQPPEELRQALTLLGD